MPERTLHSVKPSSLEPAIRRIRIGGMILLTCVISAICGFHFLGNYTWLESFWLVVITLSSVGFSEKSQHGPGMQLFMIGVILSGMTAVAYTFGGFMQLITADELSRILGHRRMSKEIDRLKGHVVLCGYGRTGKLLAGNLDLRDVEYVLIDSNAEKFDSVAPGARYLIGDATDEKVLLAAGLRSARAVIISLPSDAANVFITLTARNLCPSITIIARAGEPSTEQKLLQAGANRVVLPASSSARLMARMVTRPSTAELIELVSQSEFPEMELDELLVTPQSTLVGMDVRATEAHRKHRLLVVAVKDRKGNMIFNPDADYTFNDGDTVIVMGREEDMNRFRSAHKL